MGCNVVRIRRVACDGLFRFEHVHNIVAIVSRMYQMI